MSPDLPRIRIQKKLATLELWENGKFVFRCSIGIGRGPTGPKLQEGDCKTPEGEYRVCVKNPQSRFHLSLGLDYPSLKDAEKGLDDGRIDAQTMQRICQAFESGHRPPWDTPLGGEIYIHGGLEEGKGSRGCVALKNAAMAELYARVPLGTRVTILP